MYLSGFLVGRGLAPAAYVGTGVLDGPFIASFALVLHMHRVSPDLLSYRLTFMTIYSIIQLDKLEFDSQLCTALKAPSDEGAGKNL